MSQWDPVLYQSSHSFVWEHGRGLVELLAPRPGERILDVGCGTGQLTAEIAKAGAHVLGTDNSPAMVAQARANFPQVKFQEADVRALPFQREFDAIFSNAMLHWVKEADDAAAAMSDALQQGGRVVLEFGGQGNTRALLDAVFAAQETLGIERIHPWYYPSVGEYAAVLERHNFEVRYATLFDRPIALEGGESGLANWLDMFGKHFVAALEPEQKPDFVRLVEERGRPKLYRDGGWIMDYRRLRVMAVKHTGAT
jgi:trans-aconitate methyltransferase